MNQVGSIAYDKNLDLLFFTTNNNKLYRDIWMLNRSTLKRQLLFQDTRIGQLSVSPYNHELWGIMQSGGSASLIYSEYPYTGFKTVFNFDINDEILQISISPTGKYLAVVMHRADGNQLIFIMNCDDLKMGNLVSFDIITDVGTPENPSWSPDEKLLFWNAYTNGVSNIYKKEIY